ncbi:MAG: LacI family DNA-binding transcriptional regulator [Armatimonadetes bacterium]|nr:LacI family DNA-binding transcriptional regulator [Armatimonadota bacterium]
MANIYDVARAAGVSIATVSRVLNGSDRVSEPLRVRVLQAADRLGYRPNRLARALAEGRVHALGLMLPSDISHPFYSQLAEHVAECALQQGYEVIVGLPARADVDSYLRVASDLQDRRVLGMLLCAGADTVRACVAARGADSPPMVAVGCLPEVGIPVVTSDEEAAGYQAARHLLEFGHKHIGYLGVGADRVRRRGREAGYARALVEAGSEPLFVEAPRNMMGGCQGVQRLLEAAPHITAVVTHNDAVALGALRGLHDIRRRVPQDVSVVGFDNIRQGEYCVPALTTIDLAAQAIACEAVRVVVDLLAGAPAAGEPATLLIPPQLIIRESSAPCPGA